MRRPDELSLAERAFIPELMRGLVVTGRRFWRNLFLHIGHRFGIATDTSAAVTLQYPEVQQDYGAGYRGSHRLTLKSDGSVNCTACFLCATACPARCINIEAGEHPDPAVEKYPVRYEIDTLRCIYCGMCVEACPCDAIRMDTEVHPRIHGYRRADFIEDKALLMGRSRTLDEQGCGRLMQDMLEGYRRAEATSVRR
ncbi:MAG: NuoI/complex I 23 kDa subunit family protein [Candidatus Binatia bacterium]